MPGHQHVFFRQRRRCPPDHRLVGAFVRNARAFQTMAWTDDDRVGARAAYQSAIAIELGLKAYLLHRGFSDDWNRVHLRHDLKKALRCAQLAGLRELPHGLAELAAVLGPLYASGALRSGAVEPELPLSPEATDSVISELLDAVEATIGTAGRGRAVSRQRLRCWWRFRRAVAAHRHHVLVRAIQQLPPDCRDVFVLHRFEDMPLDEIAAHLRIDHALAETRLVEALTRLCRALDEAEARPSSERK